MENKFGKSLKVCKRGLNDIWINEYDGKVRMCGWSNYYIGNLAENTIEEIWNGELAQRFRESMLDGSYRYCNHSKCPYCANDQLDNMLVDYEVPRMPTFCSLSYQLQCNYTCKFCRKEHYVPCDCEKDNYIKIEKEVKKMMPYLKTLSSNGAGEFFCSDSIIRLIRESDINSDTQVLLETNGSLFNQENWAKIEKLGRHNLQVSVTVHSFNEATYQFLSGTGISVNQVIDNLKFISKLRKERIINKFEIATVICERNFREMPAFVQKCLDDFDMDTIRLRFFEPYGVMDTGTEWFYDVRNEFHPYHEEFERVMSDPVFKNEKVWRWQGETKSLQNENPYILEKRKALALSNFVVLKDAGERLKTYLEKKGNPRVALYGASSIGLAYIKLFKEYGVKIDTIFDTYAECVDIDGVSIKRANDEDLKKYGMIFVPTDTFLTQIYEELYRNNYTGDIVLMSCLVSDLMEHK